MRHAPHGSKPKTPGTRVSNYTHLPPTAGGVKSVCVTQFPAASENKAQTLCGSDTGHVQQRYRGTTCPQATCSKTTISSEHRVASKATTLSLPSIPAERPYLHDAIRLKETIDDRLSKARLLAVRHDGKRHEGVGGDGRALLRQVGGGSVGVGYYPPLSGEVSDQCSANR